LRNNAATCSRSKSLFKIHSSLAPADGGKGVMPTGVVLYNYIKKKGLAASANPLIKALNPQLSWGE